MTLFKGFKKGTKKFGLMISNIVNSVLLFVVYIIGVGVTSIIAKTIRKHFLNLSISKTKSYWSDLNLKKKKMEDYYRQF